ncbi:hypothetical protein [Bittarella massiliensis (ex Durand et al. 2017)]|uniref:hypothetical protein n=1 Tax=Bittarella massiliensis (ex Durand et al. 2017) TaxID=1720313 RepID=UPI001AA140C3|nr:hypothetical protein [Bittarella massiliensis (ex Durand et al. 2017)]MBO1680046.1 hypothetical protein [Bittarella massiliensis (ex Durand et al. 2017)]
MIFLLELLLRDIPEVLLLLFGLSVFAGRPVEKRRYFLSAGVLVITTILTRALPLNNGVYILLNVIVLISLATYLCKIDLLTSIKSSLIVTLILALLEAVNVFLLQLFFHGDLGAIFENRLYKTVAGLPTVLLMAAVLLGAYGLKKKRAERPRQD